MADLNWERRVLQSWGSNVRLDVNNPQPADGGNEIYNLYAISSEEQNVSLISARESGLFGMYADGTLELIGGQKTNTDGIDVAIVGSSGDVVINAEKNGIVKLRAKNIIIQADEDIDITAGRNVNINSGSGRLLLAGNTVEEAGLKGNLLAPEEQWAWRVFEGTGLPSFSFPSLVAPFSGFTDIAGSIISSPDVFTNFVQGAVTSAVSGAVNSATGGVGGAQVGALAGNAVSGFVP